MNPVSPHPTRGSPDGKEDRRPTVAEVIALRRAIQRLSLILAATVLIAVLALLRSFAPSLSKREFVLVDAQGVPQAVLGRHADGPFFSLFDSEGKARIALSLGPDGAVIRLSDGCSDQHAGLMVQSDGARLALIHANGSGLRLHADQRDARLHFQDHRGWPRLGLGIDDGSPFVGLIDTNLQPRIVMGIDESGGRLSFIDDHRIRRLSLGVHENRPFLNPVTDPEQEETALASPTAP